MNTNRIAVLIKTASIEFAKMANPILADYDLTASQCRILKFLFIKSACPVGTTSESPQTARGTGRLLLGRCNGNHQLELRKCSVSSK